GMLARLVVAVAYAEADSHRTITVTDEADRVGIAAPDGLHRLRLLELVQPFQGVPQLRRPLVVLRVARFLHALAQSRPHIERLSREKQQHVVDHAAVVFHALVADARSLPALLVIVETLPVGRFLGPVPSAVPDRN